MCDARPPYEPAPRPSLPMDERGRIVRHLWRKPATVNVGQSFGKPEAAVGCSLSRPTGEGQGEGGRETIFWFQPQ